MQNVNFEPPPHPPLQEEDAMHPHELRFVFKLMEPLCSMYYSLHNAYKASESNSMSISYLIIHLFSGVCSKAKIPFEKIGKGPSLTVNNSNF